MAEIVLAYIHTIYKSVVKITPPDQCYLKLGLINANILKAFSEYTLIWMTFNGERQTKVLS